MAKETGKFMKKHLKNKKLELYVGDEADWYSYADNDSMSYVLIRGFFKDYDDESGVITMQSEAGRIFWIAEEKIEMFWEADQGFNILETTTSTVRSGKQWLKKKNRDIM
jgi:hypothetical protein